MTKGKRTLRYIVGNGDAFDFVKCTSAELENRISLIENAICVDCLNSTTECAYLLAKLSLMYMNVYNNTKGGSYSYFTTRVNMITKYVDLANLLDEKNAYWSRFYLTQFLLDCNMKKDVQNQFYLFCQTFFTEDRKNLDEQHCSQVVWIPQNVFPEVKKKINEELKCDVTKGIVPVAPNRLIPFHFICFRFSKTPIYKY